MSIFRKNNLAAFVLVATGLATLGSAVSSSAWASADVDVYNDDHVACQVTAVSGDQKWTRIIEPNTAWLTGGNAGYPD